MSFFVYCLFLKVFVIIKVYYWTKEVIAMVYTVTLNPALDYVMKVGKLRYDDINRSNEETLYGGGKGINVLKTRPLALLPDLPARNFSGFLRRTELPATSTGCPRV